MEGPAQGVLEERATARFLAGFGDALPGRTTEVGLLTLASRGGDCGNLPRGTGAINIERWKAEHAGSAPRSASESSACAAVSPPRARRTCRSPSTASLSRQPGQLFP